MNETQMKCPKCGGELEIGVMQFAAISPVTFWGEDNIEENLVAPWSRTVDHRAWRCKKCQLAVFLYGENSRVKP